MEDLDHGAFIAPSGFTHHLHAGYCLQLSDQLEEALGSVAELTLLTLQMKLQGGFGDIDTGIDDCVVGLHSFDRVLTQPYLYELTVLMTAAPATVRVWSTGRARLWLGYGLA
jgi:hypothetical protein